MSISACYAREGHQPLTPCRSCRAWFVSSSLNRFLNGCSEVSLNILEAWDDSGGGRIEDMEIVQHILSNLQTP